MRTCRYCKQTIEPTAKVCSHCGKPQRSELWNLVPVLGIAALVFLAWVFYQAYNG